MTMLLCSMYLIELITLGRASQLGECHDCIFDLEINRTCRWSLSYRFRLLQLQTCLPSRDHRSGARRSRRKSLATQQQQPPEKTEHGSTHMHSEASTFRTLDRAPGPNQLGFRRTFLVLIGSTGADYRVIAYSGKCIIPLCFKCQQA